MDNITPIQAVKGQNPAPPTLPGLPAEGYNGQKPERGANEAPRLVVGRREGPAGAQQELSQQAYDRKASEDRGALEEAAGKLNNLMGLSNRFLEFSVHEKSHRIMVKVINSQTKEVIKEIPPEILLDMASSLPGAAGALVDEEA